MSDLRSQMLRIANELPQGDPTRREILAALRREAGSWLGWLEDKSGNMVRFWGPTSAGAITRLKKSPEVWEVLDAGGEFTSGPASSLIRDLRGPHLPFGQDRDVNYPWFRRLPRQDKKKLQTLLDANTPLRF